MRLTKARNIEHQPPIGEGIMITRCTCGSRRMFQIGCSIPGTCPECTRRFTWRGNVRVYRVMG